MNRSILRAVTCGAVLWLLWAVQPAYAVMVRGDTGSARPAGRVATPGSAPVVNRDGVVQALDARAQTIVINGARYIIAPPLLALVDKRPRADGRLTLAGIQVGMVVRYRAEKTTAGDRVVELWVMRDPPQGFGKRP